MEEQKYDATYKFGKSTVHIVAPQSVTKEQKEKVISELHIAGWAILEKLQEKKSGLSF